MIQRHAFGVRDKDLLENELLEKVYNCISLYDESYDTSFDTFVSKCLTNHMQVFLRGENRYKHNFVTKSLSIDYCVEDGDTISELIADPTAKTQDSIILSIQVQEIFDILPKVCQDIVTLLVDGLTEAEIGRTIGENTAMVKAFIEECIKPLLEEIIYEDENARR